MNDKANETNEKAGGNTYSNILKYTGLFGGVQSFNVLVSVLRNKCAAILIGATGIGLTDILNRTTDLLGAMTNLGLSFSGVRKLSEEHAIHDKDKIEAAVSTIRVWSVMTGLTGMLLCLFFAPFIATYIFRDATLTNAFRIVSPVVALLSVYGCESAVLKGTRHLKELATVSVIGSISTLVITVAFYYTLGRRGIPIALLLSTGALTTVMLAITNKTFPWSRKTFLPQHFKAGKTLLQLGIAYLSAGIAGSGVEMLVRAFINNAGSTADVGLYASGYVLCVTYTRLIFVAMDADYFPRLSSLANNHNERNVAVCKQIDVCVSLMVPMLIAFIVFLPLIVEILYTPAFTQIIGMCVAAGGYLFIKAIVAPIEYIPLAQNNSIIYFVVELAYDVLFVCLLAVGYLHFGLQGAGWALTISYIIDLLFVLSVFRKIYDFRLCKHTIHLILFQACMFAPIVTIFCHERSIWHYIAGGLFFSLSLFYSIRKFKIKRASIKALMRKRGK